jgi:Fe-S cluster assembly protein SufD
LSGVNERFGPAAAGALSPDDPSMERSRQEAATAAATVGWPSTETEEWRYSPIDDLALDELGPAVQPPVGIDAETAALNADPVVAADGERAATITIIDGWVVSVSIDPGWAAKGLEITTTAGAPEEPIGNRIGGSRGETAFDLLHRAFCPAAVTVTVPVGLSVREPVVVHNLHLGDGTASFPHLVVEGGEGSDVAVIEHNCSGAGLGLSVPVVELHAGPAARIRYHALQDLGRAHWQVERQVSTVAQQASLITGLAAFGGCYARLRADGFLTGPGASAQLSTAYYGDDDQVHDFRIFQHHSAADTHSDLLFKGAQDDASGSIYTGLIHIHPEGARSDAFQTNRNVKLSPEAWAWSVPNLEIENNEVHCSHASTVSPIDEDQRFYLASRGVPPVVADRLIVAGFFDEVVDRMSPSIRDAVTQRIAAKLDRRTR